VLGSVVGRPTERRLGGEHSLVTSGGKNFKEKEYLLIPKEKLENLTLLQEDYNFYGEAPSSGENVI